MQNAELRMQKCAADATMNASLDAAADASRKKKKIYSYALGCVVEVYADEIERELQKNLMPDLFQYGA